MLSKFIKKSAQKLLIFQSKPVLKGSLINSAYERLSEAQRRLSLEINPEPSFEAPSQVFQPIDERRARIERILAVERKKERERQQHIRQTILRATTLAHVEKLKLEQSLTFW